MSQLFKRGELRVFLGRRTQNSLKMLEAMAEDEVLSRSTDDIVLDLIQAAQVVPLKIEADAIDGGVVETKVDYYDRLFGKQYKVPGFSIHAVFAFSGCADLLDYTPSTRLIATFNATVSRGTITVRIEQSGATPDPTATKRAIEREIDEIRTMAGYSLVDVNSFNNSLDAQLRPSVERRRKLLQDRRDLAGALGFPLSKRTDAPAPVPLQRKAMGVQRAAPAGQRQPYRDEPALSEAQYEDANAVISSALLSMERTPSVVLGKDEEALRDYILVMLNGTFEGTATGETFVKSGKTDILIRVEDRHVFVGECKWWKGARGLGRGIDQLLGYLPWRDEKAALIVFIENKDATSVFGKIEEAVKDHESYKRQGKATSDETKRRNFMIGHPEDPDREIQLAVMFAVLPRN